MSVPSRMESGWFALVYVCVFVCLCECVCVCACMSVCISVHSCSAGSHLVSVLIATMSGKALPPFNSFPHFQSYPI